MPRYYFHVRDGVDRPDREGTELPGVVAARSEALMLAGKIVMDAGARGHLGEGWHVTVTDDEGLTLFVMDFLVTASPGAAQRVAVDPPHLTCGPAAVPSGSTKVAVGRMGTVQIAR